MKFALGLVCLFGVLGAFGWEQQNATQRLFRAQTAFERLHREPPIRGGSRKAGPVTTKYIMQRLDHFDPQNVNTWSMRYMENGEHYAAGGPLFIYVGGEWEISESSISRGHVYDMAIQLKGYLFYTEHRYYGQSHPTVDLRTDKLKYLNIDQALADLAHFVVNMRKTIPGAENSGVIMIGGSYSATMVSWFRQKYPHLVNGAWASSAPVFAKVEFTEYKEIVSESIRSVGGRNCAERIERAVKQTEQLLANGEYGRVAQEFRLCSDVDLSKPLDRMNFFSSLSDEFAGVVQYHATGDIEGLCRIVEDSTIADDMQALARIVTQGLPSTSCNSYGYKAMIEYYKNTAWDHGAAQSSMRQWMYQTCAEYGWYQISGSPNQIFGSSFPVELFVKLCGDMYDGHFDEGRMQGNADRTNVIYGGWNPEVTNVFFTQGQLDPWRAMGIQADLNDQSPGVVIPGASHCADLSSISAADSAEMRAAKEKILELVKKWLA
ncbi:putative serine protease K12H4.7 [Anopheles marshallii]|uniref:putative serine protease K12H4.7 n=1 Tax=Anopheles marshallii TaxID=1521116 RepID=UPI00237B1418|nr:putative serine protease K12H4.7 [Anopheles marshallii]